MRYINLLAASVISVMLVSMSACVADKTELEMQGYIKTINVIGPDEIAFEQTKATFVDNGSALVFKWAAGDTLGIFPNKGNQVEFPITTQESSTSASFDGGGWALRNNASYAAYYPFSVWNYFQNNKTVIMDYSGQVQDGNGSFAHLSAYDYLASAKTTPENGSVTFQMDRQGSILYIDIVVPEPATITSLTISCDEAIFVEKATLDISGDNPVVTPVETKESLTLTFENTTTTEQNETVRAYMAVQPVDFSSKTVTATLVTDAGTYTAPVVSRVVNKGKAAFLRFSDSFTAPTPEAVDLGLPSGLKWASFNVGANAPEEYGDYFAWGETEPYYSSQDPLTWKSGKTGYNWPSYKWFDKTNEKLTKYNTNSNIGVVDNKIVLELEDDAAYVSLGDKWRMPTSEEWTELRTKCSLTWTTKNGVSGIMVTGSNGNSIFLPAAGFIGNTELDVSAYGGVYWSSTLFMGVKAGCAWCECFVVDEDNESNGSQRLHRCGGLSVRPVCGDLPVLAESISLDKTELELECRETAVLNASVLPENATYTNVTWSSSNESVATVSSSGEVIGIYPGTATITASSPSVIKPATCTVTVTGMEAVDLSLPSGLKWAPFNLGATAPEDYGDYYAWGETEPYYEDGYAQSEDPVWKDAKEAGYNWASYKFLTSGASNNNVKVSKYVTDSYYGIVDNKTVLDPEDDAVHVNWGGRWRMPTYEEWKELVAECTWTWTSQNGVNGYLVTSNTNGNSIFLPAAGDWYNEDFSDAGSCGRYRTSSLNPYNPAYAYRIYFDSTSITSATTPRFNGFPIRPVYGDRFPVEAVLLDDDEIEMTVGSIEQLTAKVLPDNAHNKGVIWSSSDESKVTVDKYGGSVTALAAGTAIITVKTLDGGYTATCTVTVNSSSPAFVPEAVDLGLTSGLKWATCNVGANAPEEYGDFFAWGETEPYYSSQDPLTWKDGKTGYNWASYKYELGTDYRGPFSKYVTNSFYGTVDNKTVLDPEDDAAAVNWGGTWRMPTDEEWTELRTECTWTRTTLNGVNGRLVTGPNGNSIFLPAAGFLDDTSLGNAGSNGHYWSSSLDTAADPTGAYGVYFSSGTVDWSYSYRYGGQSVRPVTDCSRSTIPGGNEDIGYEDWN